MHIKIILILGNIASTNIENDSTQKEPSNRSSKISRSEMFNLEFDRYKTREVFIFFFIFYITCLIKCLITNCVFILYLQHTSAMFVACDTQYPMSIQAAAQTFA